MPHIYVLHFHSTLSHAEHYVGSTTNLKTRLALHATGQGSKLTKELHRQGIHFTLGALYETSQRNLLRIERHIKNRKNGPRHCAICCDDVRPPPGCQQMDTRLVPFAIDSRQIKGHAPTIELYPGVNARAEIEFIHSITRKEKQLGHITFQGLEEHHQGHRLTFARITDDDEIQHAGYILHTHNRKNQHVKIQQVGVDDNFRTIGIGKALVRYVQWRFPQASFSCKVRSDLAANHFWKAIGFTQTRTTKHPTSGSALNHYRHPPIIEE